MAMRDNGDHYLVVSPIAFARSIVTMCKRESMKRQGGYDPINPANQGGEDLLTETTLGTTQLYVIHKQ